MKSELILVVDDDPDILKILEDNLALDGFTVCSAATGKQALELLEAKSPGLVILDLALPDMDGIRVCRAIRQKSDVPLIMLTARDAVSEKVLGLESGADDYLVKPFDYLELAARIAARLRRRSPMRSSGPVIESGDLRIDPDSKTAHKNGVELNLTRKEFELLLLLAGNPGRALSRSAIRNALWRDYELYKGSRTIDVHIQHLRAKVEEDPANPEFIVTVQGVGYMFAQRNAKAGK